MRAYRRIVINWSYPVELDTILEKDCMNDIGIYYISRKFGDKQSILYIGKTTYNFGSRLSSHKKNWIDNYRGKKYVRLGTIVSPKNITRKTLEKLINDAEKTIIFYLSNVEEVRLVANVVSTKSISVNEHLKIVNRGYVGKLPRKIYIPREWKE